MADKFVFEEIFDGGGGSASPTLELDTTLTWPGKAADAKAVGDAVTEINQKIEELSTADQQSQTTIKSITTRLSSVDKKADDNKTSITDITSRVTALEENPGGGVTSWNDLKDKPFGETVVNGDTLTVDYNTFDGSVTVVVNGQTFVKVADVVPTLEDFANGCSAIVSNQTIAYTYAELSQSNTDNGYIVTDSFASVPSDWFGVGSGDDYVEFPKKGVYFVKNSTTALTIPNYTGFVTTTIQKIDAKYLPEDSGSIGGLSIKKIEFIDRPSLYAWLESNMGKLLMTETYAGDPEPLKCNTFTVRRANDAENTVTYCFNTMYIVTNSINDDTRLTNHHIRVDISPTTTMMMRGNEGEVCTKQEIPDAYWAYLGVSVTAYYID